MYISLDIYIDIIKALQGNRQNWKPNLFQRLAQTPFRFSEEVDY